VLPIKGGDGARARHGLCRKTLIEHLWTVFFRRVLQQVAGYEEGVLGETMTELQQCLMQGMAAVR